MTNYESSLQEGVEAFEKKFGHIANKGVQCDFQTVTNLKLFLISFSLSIKAGVEGDFEERVKRLKDEIKKKEGDNLDDWSETGKVVYYYLDRVLTQRGEK